MRNLHSVLEKIKNRENITVDFVGDSITWGLNHCKDEETYVAVFAELFSKNFPEYAVYRYDGVVTGPLEPIKTFTAHRITDEGTPTATFIRNGVGGNSVKRALNRKENFTGKMPNGEYPDLTFFMFGINDALKSDPTKFVTSEVFYMQYKELIDYTLSESSTAIVLMTPTFNGSDAGLTEYVDGVKQLAKEYNFPLIDLFSLWEKHYIPNSANHGQREWLSAEPAYDSCHPTPIGAYRMAEFIFERLLELIKNKG